MNLFSVNIHTFQGNRLLLEFGFHSPGKAIDDIDSVLALLCSAMIFTVILALSHKDKVSANAIQSVF